MFEKIARKINKCMWQMKTGLEVDIIYCSYCEHKILLREIELVPENQKLEYHTETVNIHGEYKIFCTGCARALYVPFYK